MYGPCVGRLLELPPRWLRLAAICVLLAFPGTLVTAYAADAPAAGTKTPAKGDSKVQTETPPENKFRAVLPDGATFELVSVGDGAANDKPWWIGDGSAPAKPRNRIHFVDQTPGSKKDNNLLSRLFVFECKFKGDATIAEPALVGESTGSSAGSWSTGLLGLQQMESTLSIEIAPQSARHRALEIRGGQMDDRCHLPGDARDRGPAAAGGSALRRPGGKGRRAQLPVAIKADPDDYRVVAIDLSSREHQSTLAVSTSVEGMQLISRRFPNLRLARVREFRLQMRKWTQIEFRNISLHPGQKTNFAIFIDNMPYVRSPRR